MTDLVLPQNAVTDLIDQVSSYGRLNVETGALLMSDRNSDMVQVVALAGEAGVTRRYGLFVLSMPVIDQAFTYAEDRDLQVRAQIHSHAGDAFMSRTDKSGNLNMKGFIAAVIPNFRKPPHDPSSWGWWTFNAGAWEPSEPARLTVAPRATVLTVDADGVREH
jgi:hypothetical protein